MKRDIPTAPKESQDIVSNFFFLFLRIQTKRDFI